MTKKIIERNTFKEAFADVLKLSHEELISHSIDPFLQEAFSSFEQMDFSCKHVTYRLSPDLPSSTQFLFQNTTYNSKSLLVSKEFSLNSLQRNAHYLYTKRFYSSVETNSSKPSETFVGEENGVQEWLLAA